MLWKKINAVVDNSKKNNLLKEKINNLHKSKQFKEIKNLISTTPIQDLIVALEEIDDSEIIDLFLIASQKIKMGEFFLSFNEKNRIKIIERIKPLILKNLLNDLNADDVIEIINYRNSAIQKKIIFASSAQLRSEIKKIISFNDDQAGSIMNTTIVVLNESDTVKESLNYLKNKKNEFDFEQELFVVNKSNQVIGKVKIQNLFFWNEENDSITKVMDQSFVSVDSNEEIDELIDLFQKYNLDVVPVLNQKKEILGIISNKDIISEIIDENMEDVLKFYGIAETEYSYLNSSVFEIVKSRIFWLIILLFATTFTTIIIDKFESLGFLYTAGISSAMLVPIIPVITDMCGNSGSQTTATIIQSFACNDIKKKHFWEVMFKELRIALTIGTILAFLNFVRLLLYFWISGINAEKIQFAEKNQMEQIKNWLIIISATTSSISLFLVVLCSKLMGVVIPFIAIKFNYDPAAFSTPVLTTVLDALSALIFFGLGILFFSMAIPWATNLNIKEGKITLNALYSLKEGYF